MMTTFSSAKCSHGPPTRVNWAHVQLRAKHVKLGTKHVSTAHQECNYALNTYNLLPVRHLKRHCFILDLLSKRVDILSFLSNKDWMLTILNIYIYWWLIVSLGNRNDIALTIYIISYILCSRLFEIGLHWTSSVFSNDQNMTVLFSNSLPLFILSTNGESWLNLWFYQNSWFKLWI